MQDAFDTEIERHQRAHRQSKGVKGGQRIKQYVGFEQRQMRGVAVDGDVEGGNPIPPPALDRFKTELSIGVSDGDGELRVRPSNTMETF